MTKKSLFLVTAFISVVLISQLLHAATMSGTTYSITSSVIGGGGGPMVSESGTYKMNGTIGQSTPLADTANPPVNGAGTVELNPGFWNTVDGSCLFDSAPADNDVDGVDLAAYAATGDFTQIQQFALAFGNNCK